jgi:hypothetical protein
MAVSVAQGAVISRRAHHLSLGFSLWELEISPW